MFATGGSYGGYLVAWMNGHCAPGRYAAYICHAGCYDWTAMFADDAFSWHAKELGAWYWEDPAKVASQSPHAFAGAFDGETFVGIATALWLGPGYEEADDWTALIAAGIGVSPWTVFAQGVSSHLGITIGWATFWISSCVLLAWIPLRRRPGRWRIPRSGPLRGPGSVPRCRASFHPPSVRRNASRSSNTGCGSGSSRSCGLLPLAAQPAFRLRGRRHYRCGLRPLRGPTVPNRGITFVIRHLPGATEVTGALRDG